MLWRVFSFAHRIDVFVRRPLGQVVLTKKEQPEFQDLWWENLLHMKRAPRPPLGLSMPLRGVETDRRRPPGRTDLLPFLCSMYSLRATALLFSVSWYSSCRKIAVLFRAAKGIVCHCFGSPIEFGEVPAPELLAIYSGS